MPAMAMQKAPTRGHLPRCLGKDHTKTHELSLPLNHRPGCSSLCYGEHCRNVALLLEHKCCQGVLWGWVCVSPCVTHVAVFFWMCLLISYPTYSPGCFHRGEEGRAQPLLSTVFYTGVSACGCYPGPTASSKAHLGLDASTSGRTPLSQLLPDSDPSTTVPLCFQQRWPGPWYPTNPEWGTCKPSSARGKPLLLNHPLHHRAASPP